ncbi:M15 family metallopeptidase [Isoptericola jiangsuensis]|uniref:M15 family metallopeptidase n=1 Tax=Isoptericola jiangsuensis TaxID=548579 RepID=UPI003AAF5F11
MPTLPRVPRAAGALLAATLATALAGSPAAGAHAPAEVTPESGSPVTSSPVTSSAASSTPDPTGTATEAAGAIVGWDTDEHRVAGTTWSDAVVVSAALGRSAELQHWTDGAWVVRRTLPLAATRTDLLTVELTSQWSHAPTTLWRLHVPAADGLAEITSKVKRVTTTWRASTDPADPAVLVNKSHAVEPSGWRPAKLTVPAMTAAGSHVRLQPVAADALADLATAAQEATGHRLVLVSGFRSAAYQKSLFARYAAQHGTDGADRFSARPGHSEHQTGWAADVTQEGVDFTDFGGTAASDWVAQHAWRFGFVVRYPAGAEAITGYDAEPWHLRYVGEDLAAYLDTTGLTLEEAFGEAD